MVRLADVVDALSEGDPIRHYYDRQNDEVVWVFEDELGIAEGLDDGADLAKAAEGTTSGAVEGLELARRIVRASHNAFVALPTQWDLHEHSIMEDFTTELPDSQMRQRIWDGLHRSGAFRRFKDSMYRYDLADAWYRFRGERFEQIAREWAEGNNVPLTEG